MCERHRGKRDSDLFWKFSVACVAVWKGNRETWAVSRAEQSGLEGEVEELVLCPESKVER